MAGEAGQDIEQGENGLQFPNPGRSSLADGVDHHSKGEQNGCK